MNLANPKMKKLSSYLILIIGNYLTINEVVKLASS